MARAIPATEYMNRNNAPLEYFTISNQIEIDAEAASLE